MPSPDTNTTVKVLLVEDDEDDTIITQALPEQISIPRFELDRASSYDAGLTRIKEHHHDIGLIDYYLGSRTEIDFLREANSHSPHAPIIMLTGQGNESLVLEALESRAIDYLPKRKISSETLQRVRGATFFEKPYDFNYLVAAPEAAIDHPHARLAI
ncbi:MAG: response regulator [Nitrospirota bacterium]|nr:response regulator [Nitrospirota bacterium]